MTKAEISPMLLKSFVIIDLYFAFLLKNMRKLLATALVFFELDYGILQNFTARSDVGQ